MNSREMDKYETKATHRCQESLEARVSIRLCNPYKWAYNAHPCWWLLKDEEDLDWLSHYLKPISTIKFCPFCGKNLDEKIQFDKLGVM